MNAVPNNLSALAPGTVSQTGLIVLAAGASTRMGEAKQLLRVGGLPMIARTIEAALASPVWPIVVVLGASASEIKPAIARYPILIAENATWIEGMASSLRAGLATLQSFSRTVDAVLVALCDQPGFSPETIEALLAARRMSSRSIVAARYNDRLGAPALFGRAHFAALAALSGDEGARQVIALAAARDEVEAVDLPSLALDLDTPADFARVRTI